MKILIRNSDKRVLFADPSLILADTGLTGDNAGSPWHAAQHTTADSTLAEVDALPLHFAGGMYSYDGAWHIADQAMYDAAVLAELTVLKSKLIGEIEGAVMAVYSRPVQLAREYELREADAVAFVAANYQGAPGRVLAGFATSSGMTPTAAANLVIAQSNAFRGAELSLADLRMRKYEVSRATTVEQINTIHAETIAAIKVIAAQIA